MPQFVLSFEGKLRARKARFGFGKKKRVVAGVAHSNICAVDESRSPYVNQTERQCNNKIVSPCIAITLYARDVM